jgi:outer membrane protein OmpA-like peptidoglycan-associated protein
MPRALEHHPVSRFAVAARALTAQRAVAAALGAALIGTAAFADAVRYYPSGTTPDPQVVARILGGGAQRGMKMRGAARSDEPAALLPDGGQNLQQDDAERERRIGEAAQSALATWQSRKPAAAPAGLPRALALAVGFDNDSATLSPEAAHSLDVVAQGMRLVGPGRVFVIEGHTSATGSLAHNLHLSRERADSVKRYLVQQGIPQAALRTQGLGPRRLLIANDPAAAQNRRVQFRAA